MTTGEKFLKMASDLTKARPKSQQDKFFKEEIESILNNATYHNLTPEDINYLKNAQFRKQ